MGQLALTKLWGERGVAEGKLDLIELGAFVGQLGVGPAQVMGRATSDYFATQRQTPCEVRDSPVSWSPSLTPRNTGPVEISAEDAHWSVASVIGFLKGKSAIAIARLHGGGAIRTWAGSLTYGTQSRSFTPALLKYIYS
jgi:hypothetical protein